MTRSQSTQSAQEDPSDTPAVLADQPVFAARLHPHRSLSPRGLAILLSIVGGAGLFISVPFVLIGAWPVAGFLGLDVALIYAAFRFNTVAARAFEEVVVSRVDLLLRKVTWRGQSTEWRFNPRWVTLRHDTHAEFGSERLTIQAGPQRVEIGAFLPREERAEFAHALQDALFKARR